MSLKRVFLLLLVLISAAGAQAEDVSFIWDPSISSGIAGYRFYFGTASRTYTTSVELPNVTSYTITIKKPGLYFFAVTAFNSAGDESDYSNEVSKQVFSRCDQNEDGKEDGKDYQFLVFAILMKKGGKDINGDGKINGLDAQILTNVILHVSKCPE